MNAVRYTLDIGLTVNAGHGLNYFNVQKIASLQGIRGLYIGHSIISRAVLVGMERAVREMKELIKESAVNK
jgi:pyridoxine 5-phosphate synthase